MTFLNFPADPIDMLAAEAVARYINAKIRHRGLSPELLRRAREGRCLYCAATLPPDGRGGREGYCSEACRGRVK
jgi:hypothetical protein